MDENIIKVLPPKKPLGEKLQEFFGLKEKTVNIGGSGKVIGEEKKEGVR